MPLNSFESSALVKFLSENEDPHAQETLVIYYLLRCNYFEAHKVNEKLSMTTLVIIFYIIFHKCLQICVDFLSIVSNRCYIVQKENPSIWNDLKISPF